MTAQDWKNCTVDGTINGVPTLSCLPPLITGFINWAIIFAGIVAIIIIIYGGYKYINSGGDPKQADIARKTLIYAVFGLLFIFMSFFIVRAIGQISGLDKNCYAKFGFTNCATESSPESKPKPLKCNSNQDKVCVFGNLGCKCVPKEQKCKTYGVAPECGNGKYCNLKKVCDNIPDVTNLTCYTLSSLDRGKYMVTLECPPSKDQEDRRKYGKCIPVTDPKIPNSTVPGKCSCQY